MPNPVAATAPSQSVMKKLTPSELMQAFLICFKARRAVMVHGDPGIGKSQIAMQAADALFADAYGPGSAQVGPFYCYHDGNAYRMVKAKGGWVRDEFPLTASDVRPWFKDVRAALLDSVDLRGLPMVEGGKAKWAIPEFLPTDERGGVIFLDEINRGQEMTMNGLFSLCAPPHALGDYQLPKTWIPASAVNDQDVGARKMPSALLSRFEHLDMGGEVNAQWLEDVCKIAITRDWHPMVIAFLRSFPQDLHKYNPRERQSPNPRGWEFVSQLVYQDPPISLLKALVAGQVGEAAATEFVGFYALYKALPNIDGIIMNPQSADVPTRPSQLYAVAATLARRATEKNFPQIMVYLDRLPADYNVCCVVDAVRRNKDLQSLPCFTKWAIKFHQVVL